MPRERAERLGKIIFWFLVWFGTAIIVAAGFVWAYHLNDRTCVRPAAAKAKHPIVQKRMHSGITPVARPRP